MERIINCQFVAVPFFDHFYKLPSEFRQKPLIFPSLLKECLMPINYKNPPVIQTRYANLTNEEEEDAIDSSTIFYLPPNDVQEVLVQVHDVGPAKPTSIFEMVEIDDEAKNKTS